MTLAFPDRMHVDVQTPQGALTIVATPDTAFMSMAGHGHAQHATRAEN